LTAISFGASEKRPVTQVNVVLNWSEELKAKAPAKWA
jgi:hypothetical protein